MVRRELEFYVRVINNIKVHKAIIYRKHLLHLIRRCIETENGFWGRIFKAKIHAKLRTRNITCYTDRNEMYFHIPYLQE